MKKIRSGYIAIVGRPNVGKSTLLNRLVGEKISIVSRKAQTTRHRITGIVTNDSAQYVFVDTPGFQTKFSNALNRAMNRGVTQTLSDVDLVFFVIEAGRYDAKDQAVVRLLPKDRPVILVINKTDQLKERTALLPFLAQVSAEHDYAAIVPISATKGRQTDILLSEARKHLPNEGLMFPEDDLTDKSERFLAAEYIREKVFRLLGYEFIGSKSYPEAIAVLAMGIELYPGSALLYGEIGEAYLMYGDREKARGSYRRAAEIDPVNFDPSYLINGFDALFDQIHPGKN